MQQDEQRLRDTIEFVKDHAGEIVKSGEEHAPMIFLLQPDGSTGVVLMEIKSGDDLFNIAGEMARRFQPVGYILVFEGWGTTPECYGRTERIRDC